MFNVGIMQGRICPDQIDRLQVFPSREWKNEFAEAREIGFDFIELLYDRNEDAANPLLNLEKYKEVLDLKQNTGIGVVSICADYFTKINLIKDVNRKILKKIDYLIYYANKLSVENIIIPFFDQNQLNNGDELACFLQKAQEQINNSKKYSVQICIETDLSAEVMMKAIQSAASHAKVCYDMGNAQAMGFSPEAEICTLNDIIGHVHIKDRLFNGPNVMLGEGDVDFIACLHSLREMNYQGALILETPYRKSPISEAKKNMEFVVNLLLGTHA